MSITEPILVGYKSGSAPDVAFHYAPYIPGIFSPKKPAPIDFLDLFTESNLGHKMYKELVADHAAKFSHCLYPCTVDAEQFVALVEWCISNCENQTWCWYPESTQKYYILF